MVRIMFLAGLLSLAVKNATAQSGTVNLAWQPSTNAGIVGYNVYIGDVSGLYTSSMDVGTNLTAMVTDILPGVTYYFATTAYDTNGQESDFSDEVTNRIPVPPLITVQPVSQSVAPGSPVTFSVSAVGDGPLGYQWYDWTTPIAGATSSSLSWPQAQFYNAGYYSVSVANAAGLIVSAPAILSLLDPPAILAQPQPQLAIATTSVGFSPTVIGTGPLSFHWFKGRTALQGATNSTLAWDSVPPYATGQYRFTVSNLAGVVTSQVASLTVFPTNAIAWASGAYNGLFYQTNSDGTPAIAEATAGFLGNCVVARDGSYSAKIYLAGTSCSLAGMFGIDGTATAAFALPDAGLSNLTAFLQLDLFYGSQQMTGSISSADDGNAWTASLLAELAADEWSSLSGVNLVLSPASSTNAPTESGSATGLVDNGVLSLVGALADTSPFSQTVPISTAGNVPVYVNLYTNGGLLEGWINFSGGGPVGDLTWIRPSGVLVPPGFPDGFDTEIQVGGTPFTSPALVSGQTLGNLRNDATAAVGFQFVCANNATCLALGRWVVPGNNQTHVLSLCSSSCTVLASVTVDTSDATPATYVYGSLATPCSLTAGTTYLIMSQETSGGDQFYDDAGTTVACTSLAGEVNAAYADGPLPSLSGCSDGDSGTNHAAGPLNMQYTMP
jgi:hypothetical protein